MWRYRFTFHPEPDGVILHEETRASLTDARELDLHPVADELNPKSHSGNFKVGSTSPPL